MRCLSVARAYSYAVNVRRYAYIPSSSSQSSQCAMEHAKCTTTAMFSSASNSVSIEKNVQSMKPLLISIEGNIGAGKSTIMKALREKTERSKITTSSPSASSSFSSESSPLLWTFIDEPVDIWSKLKDDRSQLSLFDLYYADRKRWSYTFQSLALLSRFQAIESAVDKTEVPSLGTYRQVFVTERCLETDRFVFTEMLRADDSIGQVEYELYRMFWSELTSRSRASLAGVIHVNTDVDTCIKRIKERNRQSEGSIDVDYLVNLQLHQNRWLDSIRKNGVVSYLPVVSNNNSNNNNNNSGINDSNDSINNSNDSNNNRNKFSSNSDRDIDLITDRIIEFVDDISRKV